ncbi:MAG TPA: hypothetical protein VFI29_09475, partial [Hanamia sp.]|nr:hypothetical protein [Hanamia sp.]
MCKKVTLLLGAGAAIPWNAAKTSEITEAMRNSQDHLISCETLGNWINKIVTQDRTVSHLDVNFETYIDLIETAHAFLLTTKTIHPNLKNSFYKFFDLKTEIKEGIDNLKWSNGSNFRSDSISKVTATFYSLIRIIGNQIIPYLDNYWKDDYQCLNEKLKEFCEYFLNTGYVVRAYTLNYDRSIPLVFESNSSGYEFFDGFDVSKVSHDKRHFFLLDKQRILADTWCNSFYNLHGSFHWSFQDGEGDALPFTIMSTKKYRYCPANLLYEDEMKTSNPNERLLQAPIITGYKKTQRINLPPFNYFFHSFFNDIFQ